LSLFFIGAACAGTSPFSIFFIANANLGLKLLGPIWRRTADGLRAQASGAGSRAIAGRWRRTPDSLRAQAPGADRAGFFFLREIDRICAGDIVHGLDSVATIEWIGNVHEAEVFLLELAIGSS
jgi:hypothetical protein